MAGKDCDVDNPSFSPVQQGAPQYKELVSTIFKDPDALNLFRNALFAQVPKEADAGALKAQHTAPALETPASKRPKRGNELSNEVIDVDANLEQVIQGDETDKTFDTSNDDDLHQFCLVGKPVSSLPRS